MNPADTMTKPPGTWAGDALVHGPQGSIRRHDFRRDVLERRPLFGGWMQLGHPGCAEVLARAGFRWVCVDLEHGTIGIESMGEIFRALDAAGCTPVVRVPWNDPVWIRRSVDAGARGVIVPLVNTAAQAESAVRAAKYPPRGNRGIGYCRANSYGADFEAYLREANDQVAVVLQVEHREAIENIESILAVPDIDALFIGPLDLSGSYGLTGQFDHPTVTAALSRFRDACAARNVATGYHVISPNRDSIQTAVTAGYSLIALGLDHVFLASAAREALSIAGQS